MNLWINALLFASLLLSSSAQTPEECQPLVSPVSLADPSVLSGKWNYLVGYTDHQFHKSMLNRTDSSWVNVTESPAGNTEVGMYHWNRVDGHCMRSSTNMKIEGNTMLVSFFNTTSELQVLPSCDGYSVLMINTTAKSQSINDFLQLIKLSRVDLPDEISYRSLYLLGRGQELTEHLEHFKKQASCLSFSGEPDFIYNPEKSFCGEDEGIRLP